jgi:FtsP/CotA-like multicopper oxidase with cupredoxin domain
MRAPRQGPSHEGAAQGDAGGGRHVRRNRVREPSEKGYDLLKDKLFRAILLLTLIVMSVAVVSALIFDGLSHRQATGAPSSSSNASAVGQRMAGPNGHVVNVNLTSLETDQAIVPAGPGVTAVTYHVWTFDGTAPGPVIRVHLGDRVHFTLHNASTLGMQHSIDFHAAMTPARLFIQQGPWPVRRS